MLFVFVNLQERLVSSMNLKCINVLFSTGIVLLYKVMLQLQNVAALHIFNCLHIQNYLNCEVTSLCTISLDDFWLRMFGYLCCVKQIYYFLIIDVAVVTLEMIDQYITTICLRLLHVRNYYYYYTHLTACCPGQHGQVGTKKVKPV